MIELLAENAWILLFTIPGLAIAIKLAVERWRRGSGSGS